MVSWMVDVLSFLNKNRIVRRFLHELLSFWLALMHKDRTIVAIFEMAE